MTIEQIMVPECYRDFRCIDVKCTDSCCAGWQVDVDADSWAYYKTVSGEFGEYLHSVMVEIPGEEGQFQLRKDGRCPFLNTQGLCDMYASLGEESLCKTCTNFPRFMEDYGGLREVGIAFSCPEAARLMLEQKEPMQFVQMTIAPLAEEDILDAPKTISLEKVQDLLTEQPLAESADWEKTAQDVLWRTWGMGVSQKPIEEDGFFIEPEEFDKAYFAQLFTCRRIAFFIVQNRAFAIQDRVLLYLDYTIALQNMMDHEQWEKAEQILQQYVTTDALQERLQQLLEEIGSWDSHSRAYSLYGEEVARGQLRYTLLPEYAAVLYQDLKHAKPQWGPMLAEAETMLHIKQTPKQYQQCQDSFTRQYQEREYEYEHLLSYFVYKYFLKAYFDDDVYGKAKIAVMGYLMVRELALCQWVKQDRQFSRQDQIELFHLYSREMEHSEENYDLFCDMLKTEEICNREHLLAVLAER